MKQITILMIAILFVINGYGQSDDYKQQIKSIKTIQRVLAGSDSGKKGGVQVMLGQDGKYHQVVNTKTTAIIASTGRDYIDGKGIAYPVFRSNDRLFIIRTSKKSGKQYKQYLKL